MKPAASVDPQEIDYPESDGLPMAENDWQFDAIVQWKLILDHHFADRDVYVAGDMFWYPVEGNPKIVIAPDVFVMFGRPRHKRRSYNQWKEDGVAPQVVFEMISPSNSRAHMVQKLAFYDTYGVEEFYIYEPIEDDWSGYVRAQGSLKRIPTMNGWTSPRLGVRFQLEDKGWQAYLPDGRPFEAMNAIILDREQKVAQVQAIQAEKEVALAERDTFAAKADQIASERDRAVAKAEQATAKADQLAAKLRALGIDPEN